MLSGGNTGKMIVKDFDLVSEPLPALKEGEILIKPEFWSVDPYARIYPISFGYKMPMTMLGSQVSEVLESRNPKFPTGSHVLAYTGWRELAVVDPNAQYDTYGKGPTALPKSVRLTTFPMAFPGPSFLVQLGCPATLPIL